MTWIEWHQFLPWNRGESKVGATSLAPQWRYWIDVQDNSSGATGDLECMRGGPVGSVQPSHKFCWCIEDGEIVKDLFVPRERWEVGDGRLAPSFDNKDWKFGDIATVQTSVTGSLHPMIVCSIVLQQLAGEYDKRFLATRWFVFRTGTCHYHVIKSWPLMTISSFEMEHVSHVQSLGFSIMT